VAERELAPVRKVQLYDARHAFLTYLSVSGVPGPIVAAWAGHADLSMARRVYVHPSAQDLEQTATRSTCCSMEG
jgi:integrase